MSLAPQGDADYKARREIADIESGTTPVGVASALAAGGTIGAGAVPASDGDDIGTAAKRFDAWVRRLLHPDGSYIEVMDAGQDNYLRLSIDDGSNGARLTSGYAISFWIDGQQQFGIGGGPPKVATFLVPMRLGSELRLNELVLPSASGAYSIICGVGDDVAVIPMTGGDGAFRVHDPDDLASYARMEVISAALTFYDASGVHGQFYNNFGARSLALPGCLQCAQIAEPTPASNTACFYASDVAGTAEAFAVDEAGNQVQITAHATDYPADMVPEDDPWPKVGYEYQRYLGLIRWSYRGTERLETLAAYQARCQATGVAPRGIRLHDWDDDQATRRAAREAEQARWDATNSAVPDRVTARHRAQIAQQNREASPEDLARLLEERRADIEAETATKRAKMSARPADYIPKAPPPWLAKRLGR